MVQEFLEKLCAELSIETVPKLNEGNIFRFAPDIDVALTDLNPGVSMQSVIAACPASRREDLFIYLMKANLLGQGTGNARIGLDRNDKNLTLSLGLPYEINYQVFKEAFEEFVNHVIYWRNAIAKFENEKPMY